jgi:hypothetical protein
MCEQNVNSSEYNSFYLKLVLITCTILFSTNSNSEWAQLFEQSQFVYAFKIDCSKCTYIISVITSMLLRNVQSLIPFGWNACKYKATNTQIGG